MNNCWHRRGHVSLLVTLGLRSSNLRRIPGLTYRQMASGKSWVRETLVIFTPFGGAAMNIFSTTCVFTTFLMQSIKYLAYYYYSMMFLQAS